MKHLLFLQPGVNFYSIEVIKTIKNDPLVWQICNILISFPIIPEISSICYKRNL